MLKAYKCNACGREGFVNEATLSQPLACYPCPSCSQRFMLRWVGDESNTKPIPELLDSARTKFDRLSDNAWLDKRLEASKQLNRIGRKNHEKHTQ